MNNQNDKNSNSVKAKAARKVIVGLLVLCLIGGLSIYAINRAIENAVVTEVPYEDDAYSTAEEPDTSVSAEIPITDSLSGDDAGSQSGGESGDESQSGESSAPIMPVQGEISKSYSGDSLVYSATLDQYLCHKAIDISAPAGSRVITVLSGTVTSVDEDDRYGSCVTVSHGDGLESRYCCMGEITVSEGDVVTKGDQIGTVGEDALFEKADGPHLHFEVLKDGELINPDEITQ